MEHMLSWNMPMQTNDNRQQGPISLLVRAWRSPRAPEIWGKALGQTAEKHRLPELMRRGAARLRAAKARFTEQK
jgi:hypothetical protein